MTRLEPRSAKASGFTLTTGRPLHTGLAGSGGGRPAVCRSEPDRGALVGKESGRFGTRRKEEQPAGG